MAAASDRAPRDPEEACRRWTLIVVCVSTALLLLNVSAPNVALSDIENGIGASFSDLEWVLSGYALCLAVFQLTAGSLADRFGRRRLFLIGLGAFTLASLACTLAPSPPALIAARAVQGSAAAVIFPSSLALLAQEFQGAARARAIGIWGATIGLAFAAGPLAGGALVDGLGWRAIFGLSVVLGVPVLALALLHVRESRDPDPKPVDVPGVTTLVGGLFLLVFAILRGNTLGWTSAPILALFAGGVVLLGAFVAVERRARAPMLDLRLFSNRTFTGASVVVALMAASNFGAFVYISFYLLEVRLDTPLQVGLEVAPLAIVAFLASTQGPRVARRLPIGAVLALGMLMCSAGSLLMLGVRADSSWTHLLPGLVLGGAGVGTTNPVVTLAHLGVLPPAQSGLASGVNNTARQLGVAIGIAVQGALLQARLGSEIAQDPVVRRLGAARTAVVDRARDGDLEGALRAAPASARDGVQHAFGVAFSSGLNEVLAIAGGLALVGALAGAVLVRTRDFVSVRAPEPEPVVAEAA